MKWIATAVNGNGHSAEAVAGVRRLKSGAPAHEFTPEERRRGAERTNELRRATRAPETRRTPPRSESRS
jgi:hypothetical protein